MKKTPIIAALPRNFGSPVDSKSFLIALIKLHCHKNMNSESNLMILCQLKRYFRKKPYSGNPTVKIWQPCWSVIF